MKTVEYLEWRSATVIAVFVLHLGIGTPIAASLAATNLPPAVRLTANQAVEEALKANPGLRASDHHVAAADRRKVASLMLCDVTNPPPGFVSGATVGVDVQSSSASGLVVPADALLEGDRGAWVFTADNGVARPVQVEALDRSLNEVAVKGGVRAGESVIVARQRQEKAQ